MFPITNMSDEEQLKAVIEEIHNLEDFVVLGRRKNTGATFCSSTVTNPVQLSNLILGLMLGAPQFVKPIMVAIDRYWEIKTQCNNPK